MKKLVLSIILGIFTVFSVVAQETTEQKSNITHKESLEDIVRPYVKKLLEGAEQGVSWATQEIPAVVQQYIVFTSVTKGFYVSISIFLLVFTYKIVSRMCGGAKSFDEAYDNGTDVLYIFANGIGHIAGIIVLLSNVSTFIKVTFFPKLFLVEKFIELF